MTDPAERKQQHEALDAKLASWRQGDYVIGPLGFVVRFNTELPLRSADRNDSPDSDLYEDDVEGLVVLTQTCDIVRQSRDRPFVEVGPLVKLKDKSMMDNIRRGMIPRYAYLSGAAPQMLVADLDRVMTVEKGLLGTWTRQNGCTTDQDQRDLAEALSRKRARFAFPDEFVSLVEGLRTRITHKHTKESSEGKCLRSLREIRVTGTPRWNAQSSSLKFWFIVNDGSSPEAAGLQDQCRSWMNLVKPNGSYSFIDHDVVTLDEISAREYLTSERLDLDHLSRAF